MFRTIQLRVVVCTCGDAEQYGKFISGLSFFSWKHFMRFTFGRVYLADAIGHDSKMQEVRAHFLLDSHEPNSLFLELWGSNGSRDRHTDIRIVRTITSINIRHPDPAAVKSLASKHIIGFRNYFLNSWLESITPHNWEPPST